MMDSCWLKLPLWVFAYSGMKVIELIGEFVTIMGYSSDADRNIFKGMKKRVEMVKWIQYLKEKNSTQAEKSLWEKGSSTFSLKTIIELEKAVSSERQRIEVMQGWTFGMKSKTLQQWRMCEWDEYEYQTLI